MDINTATRIIILKKTKNYILSVFLIFNIFFLNSVRAEYKGYGVDSLPPDVLKKYAPPPLEENIKNKLTKMLDISAPGMGMLSSDKKTLYFPWKVTGLTQIWKLEKSKGFPDQLTSGNDEVTLNEVSSDGNFLIVSKDSNGQENPGIYKLNLKNNTMEELFRKSKVQARFSFLTEDSSSLYFTANDKKADSYSVYKMKLEDKSIETIFDGEGRWVIADFKENGKSILLAKYSGAKQNEFYDLNTQTKELTPIIGQNEKEKYEVSYSSNPNEYLVLTNKLSDFNRLYLFKEGKLKLISPELKYEISDFSIDRKRIRIIYSINRDGYTDISVLDAKTYKAIPSPNFPTEKGIKPDQLIKGTTTKDGKVTMFGVVNSRSPRLSYSYDWKGKKFTQWVRPSTPEVDLSKFAISELLYYETRDHVRIPMFVRFPKVCRLDSPQRDNCPVVVNFHGGPESQSLPGFSVVAQSFVDENFIFVEPNVRGSDGYGRKWIEMDNGRLRENVITDIEDAAIWIKKNWKSSSGQSPRIGVMGGSYGGYSAMMGMTRFAGAYEAGVSIVGMSNLITFLNNTAPYRRILRTSEYGDPEVDKEALKKLSPITYVDQVKAPFMIIQGANDPRVPASEAVQIQEVLSKKNIPSQLILFADEGHGSGKKENKILELGHTLEFFNKHLK